MEGWEVPDTSVYVSFHTNTLGYIVGTGSDISEHIPPCCPDLQMRSGKISIAVQAGKTAGALRLYTEATESIGAVAMVNLEQEV